MSSFTASKRSKNDKAKRRRTKINNDRYLDEIAGMLENLKFKKALLGVDELDVWSKIKSLDEMYHKLYIAQEIKYRTLLEEYKTVLTGQKSAILPLKSEDMPESVSDE